MYSIWGWLRSYMPPTLILSTSFNRPLAITKTNYSDVEWGICTLGPSQYMVPTSSSLK